VLLSGQQKLPVDSWKFIDVARIDLRAVVIRRSNDLSSGVDLMEKRSVAGHEHRRIARTKLLRQVAMPFLLFGAFAVTFLAADAALNGEPASVYLQTRTAEIRRFFGCSDPGLHSDRRLNSPLVPAATQTLPDNYAQLTSASRIFHVPGLRLPPVRPAREMQLPGQTPVIGVVVNGHCRAYLLQAMEVFSAHVINDPVGHVPVTITYCMILKCTRVFTRDGAVEPLDVALGGIHDGRMALEIDGQRFAQDAPELPVDDLEFSRTSWAEWKAIHPDSDVFVGEHESLTAD
jgi:hypothetical protein